MALWASSCVRFNLRTRAWTRLEPEVQGVVVAGNGGNGKRSRQREGAVSAASSAPKAGAPKPCALSYIPAAAGGMETFRTSARSAKISGHAPDT